MSGPSNENRGDHMKRWVWIIMVALSAQLCAAVNLNTASVEELTTLPGIGNAMAEKIVAYREKHGFKDTRELMNIKGIGEKKYEKLKDDLSL